MANKFEVRDGTGIFHVLFLGDGTDTLTAIVDRSEFGHNEPAKQLDFDGTPNRWDDQFRGSIYQHRRYGFGYMINQTTPALRESAEADFYHWNDGERGGIGIRRTTENGNVRLLDCRLASAETTRQSPTVVIISPTYEAGQPFWRSAARLSFNGTFDGTNKVFVLINNKGDRSAPILITVTGAINTPKIVINDDELEMRQTSLAATDTITANGESVGEDARTIIYNVLGSGVDEFVQASGGSKFLEAPVGISWAELTATSGTATITFEIYTYYRVLYSEDKINVGAREDISVAESISLSVT